MTDAPKQPISKPLSQEEAVAFLRRFERGDESVESFEKWLYYDPHAELLFGEELFGKLIAISYREESEVDDARSSVLDFLDARFPTRCKCERIRDLAVLDMDMESCEYINSLTEIARRGRSLWWLTAMLCRQCGTAWLVASEERQNDVFCMRRLRQNEHDCLRKEGVWPHDFDQYETLLKLGRDDGKRVEHLEPRSLICSVRELARNRPGIRVSELASLLNLSHDNARALALSLGWWDRRKINFDI